jgi:hypothetical protein
MNKIRGYLFLAILAAIAIHVLWLAIAPVVPYAIGGLIVISVLGALYHRKRRW